MSWKNGEQTHSVHIILCGLCLYIKFNVVDKFNCLGKLYYAERLLVDAGVTLFMIVPTSAETSCG